jgi:hypothetical protein
VNAASVKLRALPAGAVLLAACLTSGLGPPAAASGLEDTDDRVSSTKVPNGAVDPGSSLTYLSSLTRSTHGSVYRLDGLYSAGAGLTSVR